MTPLVPIEILRIEQAAAEAAAAADRLHIEIREARTTNSLRALAEASGLSHETIRRICE